MEEAKFFQGEFTQIGKLWRRTIAYIADGFILLLPAVIIMFGYYFMASGVNFQHILQKPKPEDIKTAVTLQVMLSLVYLVYFTYFIGKSGQSPGKKARNKGTVLRLVILCYITTYVNVIYTKSL